MKLHSLAMASTEPSVLEERAKRCTHCSHTGMQRVQSNGQGGATAFGPQPPPPADSRKGAADCIKKFTVHCRVSNCLRLFFSDAVLTQTLSFKKQNTCTHAHTQEAKNLGTALQLVTEIMKKGEKGNK